MDAGEHLFGAGKLTLAGCRLLPLQDGLVVRISKPFCPSQHCSLRTLARSRRSAPASERFGRCPRQQAGADRLDRAGTRAQL
jgi:hypothetical protein